MTREEAPKQDAGSAIIEATSDLSQNKIPVSLLEGSSSIVPSDLNSVNVTLRDCLAGEFNKKSFTENPSLDQFQPMVPLTSLFRTLSLETPNQDVGSVTGSDTIAKLDSEKEKSIMECDSINGDDDIGVAAENHKKISISSSKCAGTGTSITLEDLQQHCYLTSDEAAKKLGVSTSTFKRACREHGISNWLHVKRRKKSESPSEMKSMNVTNQDIVANPVQEVQFLTVKAKCRDHQFCP